MTDSQKRFEEWSEVMFKAFLEDVVSLGDSICADDYTWTAVNAFGEHEERRGRESLRGASAVRWGMHNARLLKNELLLADEDRGIYNAVIRWTGATETNGPPISST